MYCLIESSTTIDDYSQVIDDISSINSTDNPVQLRVDKYDEQVKIVRLYLIFGYIFLLIIVMLVCYITNKKSVKYNPKPCSYS